MIPLILACWFTCQDCPSTPPFNATLLYKEELIYNRTIKACCLDNGQMRPMYYFKLEGFTPHQTVTVKACEFLTYDEPIIEIDSKGKATIIAFLKDGIHVPDAFKMEFFIESETIGIEIYAKDPS